MDPVDLSGSPRGSPRGLGIVAQLCVTLPQRIGLRELGVPISPKNETTIVGLHPRVGLRDKKTSERYRKILGLPEIPGAFHWANF